MKRAASLILAPLVFLLLWTVSLAQTEIPGVPGEWLPIVTVAIGLAAAKLVAPLTSLAKWAFKTTGPSTVVLSAVLSVLVGMGFTVWLAVAASADVPWGHAAFAAAVGFFKSNGDYLKLAYANTKALNEAAPLPTVPVTPPRGGLE